MQMQPWFVCLSIESRSSSLLGLVPQSAETNPCVPAASLRPAKHEPVSEGEAEQQSSAAGNAEQPVEELQEPGVIC